MLNYYQLLFYFPTKSVGIFGNFQKKSQKRANVLL